MSHVTGTVQTVTPALVIGPDSGAAPAGPDLWVADFAYAPPPIGVMKYVILHFTAASLPANNQVEVDLGYDTDVFTAADGTDFWTRPINVFALGGTTVQIRYRRNGAATGAVTLTEYGRGEQHHGEQDPSALSNCDPFLGASPYAEPIYDPLWFCPSAPDWENVACVPTTDFRLPLSRSVGMIVSVDPSTITPGLRVVSTCSVTLIDADIVITAGHCLKGKDASAASASVIFDYATNCDGTRPSGYAGRFFKVRRILAYRYSDPDPTYAAYDYCIMQIQAPPGLTPVPVRHDVPGIGESVFGLHHPNGAIKKLSPPHPGFTTVASSSTTAIEVHHLDVSGGSSGSGVFDTTGRIAGVLSAGGACDLFYFPTATIIPDAAAPPGPPPPSRDVMIVFDRSGSMSLPAGTGNTKMVEADQAAALFVSLVRTDLSNRVGLVSFSTTASSPADFPIAPATLAARTALIGPSPYTTGIVGSLVANGATTIGGGLQAAQAQFPAPGANPRSILLLTDGLQNTPPMIADVAVSLAGIDVDVIGFGTEANLDGTLLAQLADSHHGLYHRAGDPLSLRKFFALAFGDIFEAGILMDPDYVLPKGTPSSAPVPFDVCGEEKVTVVCGWSDATAALRIVVKTPAGASIDAATPGITAAAGTTWAFLRIPLPHAGERDGAWSVVIERPAGDGEFRPPAPEVRFFVSVIATGGPRLAPYPQAAQRWYTGDPINPMAALGYLGGRVGLVDDGKVMMTVSRPDASIGTLLSRAKLGPPATLAADTIPARQATLVTLEAQHGGTPLVGYTETTFEMFDDAAHNHGSFEESGVFGNPQTDLLKTEGNYTFHAVATYGGDCVGSREASWSLHVAVGIDASATTVTSATTGTNPDGTRTGTITVTPADKYGNLVGPGLGGGFTVTPGGSTTTTGSATDNGDGSYTIPVTWNPAAGLPGVTLTQPDRPTVVVTAPGPHPSGTGTATGCSLLGLPWWAVLIVVLLLIVIVLLLLRH
jgi:hypothetical protein